MRAIVYLFASQLQLCGQKKNFNLCVRTEYKCKSG